MLKNSRILSTRSNAFVIFFQDKKSYKNSGEIHLTYLQLRKAYSFLDYVKGGTELACTFAIDFTASNGNPSSPESLHYFLPNGKLVISKENNNSSIKIVIIRLQFLSI